MAGEEGVNQPIVYSRKQGTRRKPCEVGGHALSLLTRSLVALGRRVEERSRAGELRAEPHTHTHTLELNWLA
eukprot:SAG11_NODE_182_length_13233_cov_59.525238_3_plen_72_part_00